MSSGATSPASDKLAGIRRGRHATPAIRRPPQPTPRRRRPRRSLRGFLGLALGSAGVVYGDIGTSPLYAFKESIAHLARAGGRLAQADVIGVISLMLWTLMVIVTLKYVTDPDALRQPRRRRHALADGPGAEGRRPGGGR